MTYSLILALLTLFFMGKTFEKMGHTFWEGFIPIYNLYILLEELERPLWWIILFFILGSEFFINYRMILRSGKEAGSK